jgi:hypothetical protein
MKKLLFVAMLFVAACGGSSENDSISPNALTDGMVAIVDDVNATVYPNDPFTIDSASISGDVLTITTHFGGGCQRHVFSLLLGRAFMESHPVQIHARVAHNARRDACDAIVRQTLTFDLTRLKQRYRQLYGGGPAIIHINLNGAGRQLRYSFD